MKTTTQGYKYNLWIFRGAVLILLLIAVGYLVKYGVAYKPYFKCDGPDLCENPVPKAKVSNFIGMEYKIECNEPWCNSAYLPPGEYGKKPPLILKLFLWVVLALILGAFFLNHFIYNRGRKFHYELPKFFNKLKELEE